MNYSKSAAEGFEFLSVVVTAANMPLYLFRSLAVLLSRARRQLPVDGNAI
ncbi:MAG TPA: hypothetical protein VHK24_00125 [Steroidobacter sp.]|nr:hypothetical protein [Steroidobacter sp.]